MRDPDSGLPWRGVLGLLGALVSGSGVHWLITPIDHPQAPPWRYGLVWLQVLGGLALLWSARPLRRPHATD